MTSFHLAEHALLALQACTWLGGGALIGAVHLMTLRWNVSMLAVGRALPLVMVLQLARFVVLAGMLAVTASRFGTLPLLLAAAGIVAARIALLRSGEQA